MKTFKKLATLSMALLLALGLGAMTACNGDESSSASSSTAPTSTSTSTESSVTASTEDNSKDSTASSSDTNKTYNHYKFIVLDAAGNKVGEGYQVQLCIVNEQGETVTCYNPVATVNGECVYDAIPNNALGEYEAHVLDATYSPVTLTETVVTSADAFGAYTLQLAE